MNSSTVRAGLAGMLLVCGTPVSLFAQGPTEWPLFTIERIGLFGTEYRDIDGSESSQVTWVNDDGQIYGDVYVMGNSSMGRDAWWYDGSVTHRVGLIGPEYQSSAGRRWSVCRGVLGTRALGTTSRFASNGTELGYDAWVTDGVTTQRLGLEGPAYVGSTGYRSSMPGWFMSVGLVGETTRIRDVSTPNGKDSWLWDGAQFLELGLHGDPFTGPGGYRKTEVLGELVDGTLFGVTYRIAGVGGEQMEEDGRRPWVLQGTTCVPIGLAGPEYTGSSGYLLSQVDTSYGWNYQELKGATLRITGEMGDNGVDPWIWDGTNTVRIGPAGGQYESPTGYRYGKLLGRDRLGNWVGWSAIENGPWGYNGNDAWVKVGDEYRMIGLFGPQYLGPSGYRIHAVESLNQAGFIAGRSCVIKTQQFPPGTPYIASEDIWVWNGVSVSRVGLLDEEHISSTTDGGYTHVNYVAFPGVVVGTSNRYGPEGSSNGADTWGWNGQTTVMTGLVGMAYTGINGLRSSENIAAIDNSMLGTTKRYLGVNTDNGVDTWVWNGVTTRQVGLTGGEFTSPSGFQRSQFAVNSLSQTANIHTITGSSWVFDAAGNPNGSVAWVFDGATTHRLGLNGPLYRGQAGYSLTVIDKIGTGGRIVGRTRRISGVNTSLGDEAWYYDPATGVTSSIAAALPVQPSSPNGYFDTRAYWLTDEGYAAGQYDFPSWDDGGFFIYRPDLGAIDPKNLIAGGATASGWEEVYPYWWETQTGFDQIVGGGRPATASPGAWVSMASFVMRRSDTACPIDIGAAGGVAGHDGVLDNNDLIVFITQFFGREAVADMGSAGGMPGPDGQFDNNDFIVFITRFFAGCN